MLKCEGMLSEILHTVAQLLQIDTINISREVNQSSLMTATYSADDEFVLYYGLIRHRRRREIMFTKQQA